MNCSSDSTLWSWRDPPRFFRGGSPVLELLFVPVAVEAADELLPPVALSLVAESFSGALFRDRRELELFAVVAGRTGPVLPPPLVEDDEVEVPDGVPARTAVTGAAVDPEDTGRAVGVATVVDLLSSPPPPDAELALVLLLTVDDWAAATVVVDGVKDDVAGPPSLVSSLDGVEARESLSLLSPLPFFEPPFLFLLELACNLETSFCRCTLASLYLRTLFSGTHSSQLEKDSIRRVALCQDGLLIPRILTFCSIRRSG